MPTYRFEIELEAEVEAENADKAQDKVGRWLLDSAASANSKYKFSVGGVAKHTIWDRKLE